MGVEYVREGNREQARAEREVILCGGAVNSPQLLMLSGVGPADHLKSLDISVIADVPGVGRNLQDHLLLGVAYRCKKAITLDRAENLANLLEYWFLGMGPLTSNICEAGGFVRTRPELPAPNVQLNFGPAFYVNHGFARHDDFGFSIGPSLIRPESVGWLKLRSSDAFAPPVIQPNYLWSESDRRMLVESFHLARSIARARAFEEFRGPEVYPGEGVQNEQAVSDYISNIIETQYHPVGTCKMGRDAMAVVDARLCVRGVERLRVADASIMPAITGGNTNAPTVMIAEKVADLIRQDC